jgi:hypothetical protein
MPRTYTIAVVLKEHGANGPKPRGSREERTHSQAARTRAAFETQKIRRDSFVLQPDLVEAAGRTDSGTDMTLCVLYLFPGGASRPSPRILCVAIGQRPELHLRLLLL